MPMHTEAETDSSGQTAESRFLLWATTGLQNKRFATATPGPLFSTAGKAKKAADSHGQGVRTIRINVL